MATLPPLDFGPDTKPALPPLDFGDDATTALPPLDFGDSNAGDLPPLDFGDAQSAAAPAQKPVEAKPVRLGGFLGTLARIGMADNEIQANKAQATSELASDTGKLFTPSGQAELLADPATAGVAGAIIAPATVLSGIGASPAAESEYENRHAAKLGGYEYTPQGNIDTLTAEKIVGSGARMLGLGGLGLGAAGIGATEATAKAADIAQNEPGELGTVGGAARVGVAGLSTAIPMKAGAAIEQAIASKGLSGAQTFIANALADAGVGAAAGTVQKATEMLASGVSPTSGEFWQGLKPTAADAAMIVPSAIAAGVGGAQASGARRAQTEHTADVLGTGEVAVTPERAAVLQDDLQGDVDLENLVSGIKERYADGRAFRPEDVGVNLTPMKGASNELPKGEGQGQAPGRKGVGLVSLRNAKSQAIEATPTTAGEGVINQRGEQIAAPGEPAGTGTAGPYGDAKPNPIWSKILRPEKTPGQNVPEPTTQTPEQQQSVADMEAHGDSLRNEDGELPRRIHGVNLRTLSDGGDEAKKNFIAGAMLLDNDRMELDRQVKGGIFERAAKITRFDNPATLKNLKPDGGYSDAEVVALADKTAAALKQARENFTPENLQTLQDYLSAKGKVAYSAGSALGAHNLVAEAMDANATPLELAVYNTQKMWASKDHKEIPKDVLKNLLEITDPNDREAITRVLKKVAEKHAGILGQLDAFRYGNMLSSPVTQGLNTISNTVKLFSFPVVHGGARAFDSIGFGQRQLATGETRAAVMGARAGIYDAARNFRKAIESGFTWGDVKAIDPRQMKVEMKGGSANPLNYPSRLLLATDEFFKTLAESGSRSMYAHRDAYFAGKSQGLKGKALAKFIEEKTPRFYDSKATQKRAQEFAKQMVWQNTPPLANVRFHNSRLGNFALSHIMPFYRVITNVANEGLDYTGKGLIAPLRGSKLTREQKGEALTKALIGLPTAIALVTYGADGNITTDAPKDPRERELFYEMGKRESSIRIGNRWVDYRGLGPLAFPLMAVAKYNETFKNKPDATRQQAAQNAAFGVLKAMTELPVFSGFSGLLDAIDDPERRGKDFIANMASQYVPMSAGQRFMNTNAIGSRLGLGSATVPDAESVKEKVQAGTIPLVQRGLGLSPLSTRVTGFGQPTTRKGTFPESGTNPLYMELDRLGIVPPGKPDMMKVEATGKPRKLTTRERTTILESGQPAFDQLSAYIASEAYKRLPDEQKKTQLRLTMDKLVSGYRKRGQGLVRLRGNL